MTRLQVALQRACQELGLTIVSPFHLVMRNELRIDAQALLLGLGATRGMIIVGKYDDLRGFSAEIQSLGYGFSVLDEPSGSEEFELGAYVEMFSEWGWEGAETNGA